jgi:hypothetical protein
MCRFLMQNEIFVQFFYFFLCILSKFLYVLEVFCLVFSIFVHFLQNFQFFFDNLFINFLDKNKKILPNRKLGFPRRHHWHFGEMATGTSGRSVIELAERARAREGQSAKRCRLESTKFDLSLVLVFIDK